MAHTRRLPTDDQNDTDKRQDRRAFSETGVDCTGQVLTHTWNLTDSVFDVRRYTENPVPERSGSTSEELREKPLLHRSTETENTNKNERREEVLSDLLHLQPARQVPQELPHALELVRLLERVSGRRPGHGERQLEAVGHECEMGKEARHSQCRLLVTERGGVEHRARRYRFGVYHRLWRGRERPVRAHDSQDPGRSPGLQGAASWSDVHGGQRGDHAELGKQVLKVITRESEDQDDVNQALMSVARIFDAGHSVIFNPEGGDIRNNKTGDETKVAGFEDEDFEEIACEEMESEETKPPGGALRRTPTFPILLPTLCCWEDPRSSSQEKGKSEREAPRDRVRLRLPGR